ncbi:DUF2508 family protein [Clostridium sp. Cult3]|uniref:DUF2508 family protein n=1 Tax=Clostridium sp. Cult3 TaxID=2079004 RepID=UPI001F170E1F|nr:DUF2508 family protein [Clostridium sp. Cult3]MCF6460889.1 DUF2508 domain-containing protein [Clostridium sp. Cult3]
MAKNKSYYEEKAKKIIEYANLLSNSFKAKEKTEEERILESLKEAHREWKDKEEYFQSVKEPELIDHAIYELEASKIKYMYLLKKMKKMNIE